MGRGPFERRRDVETPLGEQCAYDTVGNGAISGSECVGHGGNEPLVANEDLGETIVLTYRMGRYLQIGGVLGREGLLADGGGEVEQRLAGEGALLDEAGEIIEVR